MQLASSRAAVAPNRPAGHAMGPTAPEGQYVPGWHSEVQGPAWPTVLANVPGTQGEQTAAPGELYLPAVHCTAVGDVEPAGHAKPAVQLPVHVAVDVPAALL